MDCVADHLTNGLRFRVLTVADVLGREVLAIEAGQQLRSEHVVEPCNRLVAQRRAPKRIFVDDASKLTGRLLDLWASHHGVWIDFSRPGKPTNDGLIETFDGSLRDECLNVDWLVSIEKARAKIESRRRDYDESRPQHALGEQTPAEFAGRRKGSEFGSRSRNAANQL